MTDHTDDSQLQLVHALHVTRYSVIAAATILFYDHLISLDREIDLIWKKRWSVLKGVFIFHRYFGLLCVILELAVFLNQNITPALCSFWFRWESVGFSVAILTSELVLVLWVFVIYNNSLRIATFLGTLFLGEAISVFLLIGRSFRTLSHVKTDLLHDFNMPYCSLDPHDLPPTFFSYYWVPILVFNLVILCFLLTKGYQIFMTPQPRKQNRLLLAIYKNTVLNFAGMVSAYLLCCVFWLKADFALGHIPVVLSLSLSIINATRLLLNIRYAYFAHMDSIAPISTDKSSRIINLTSVCDASGSQWMYELRELKWNG